MASGLQARAAAHQSVLARSEYPWVSNGLASSCVRRSRIRIAEGKELRKTVAATNTLGDTTRYEAFIHSISGRESPLEDS